MPHAAGVDEIAVIAEIAQQQRAEMRSQSFRVGPADDDELLAVEPFGFAPKSAVSRRIPALSGEGRTFNHNRRGAWSPCVKADFSDDYWRKLWRWYEAGGYRHVAAYLDAVDLSQFDAKAPPPKTDAFWDIVDSNRAPEDAEMADVIDKLSNPDAVTLTELRAQAGSSFFDWLCDRKNRRVIGFRLEACGYSPVRNPDAQSGLWQIKGERQAVYCKAELCQRDRLAAARKLAAKQ